MKQFLDTIVKPEALHSIFLPGNKWMVTVGRTYDAYLPPALFTLTPKRPHIHQFDARLGEACTWCGYIRGES